MEAVLEPGGKFWYHAPDQSRRWGDGKVLESDPPRRLVTTWHALWNEEMAAEEPSRVSDARWMFVLSSLKTLLETGQALGEGAH